MYSWHSLTCDKKGIVSGAQNTLNRTATQYINDVIFGFGFDSRMTLIAARALPLFNDDAYIEAERGGGGGEWRRGGAAGLLVQEEQLERQRQRLVPEEGVGAP